MKSTILTIAILISVNAFSQKTNLDSLIDRGNEQYQNGNKVEALNIWRNIEEKASPTSSTYGTTLGNILYYYTHELNEPKALDYYIKIMNSKLNDKDRNFNGLKEYYKNYRFNANKSMASFYAMQKNYKEALKYINIADEKVIYEETSLTSIIYNKIDLANYKKQLYLDLEKPDSAFYVLLKRAFEYDYKNMYKNWATVSTNNYELNLAKAILKKDTSNIASCKFKSELDSSLTNLEIKYSQEKYFASFIFRGLKYDIIVYKKRKNIQDYITYLKESIFYIYLESKCN